MMQELRNHEDWNVFWCRQCNIPVFLEYCPLCGKKTRSISGDRRPVSETERRMLERTLQVALPTFLFARHNFIYFGEDALLRLTVKTGDLQIAQEWLSKLDAMPAQIFGEEYRLSQWDKCLCANRSALSQMEKEATSFIKAAAESYPGRVRFVSFSGGKDSALVATLVNKVLGPVPLLFSDTTIEYPPTYKYITEFAQYLEVPLMWQRPQQTFLQLCDSLDPPSRVIRWCCTVCKSQPINRFYNSLEHEILNYDGIRRAESARRAQYPRVFQVPKYAREVTARPILYWPTFAVWAYIYANEIPCNPMYDLGFSRVGCMYCPSNRGYNEYLTRLHFPDLFTQWQQYLQTYATREGKPSPEEYVHLGYWKERNVRREKKYSVEKTTTCLTQPQYFYDFAAPIGEGLLEFLKPLGTVSVFMAEGKACFTVGSQNPFLISGVIGDNRISIAYADQGNKEALAQTRVERQIEKYLNCVGCGGCVGVCPKGAIAIENRRLIIDSNKCTRCGRCTTRSYIERGCVALGYRGSKQAIKKGE